MISSEHAAEHNLDLSKYRSWPRYLIVAGGLVALIGAFVNRQQFAFSWLLSFMFYLSFGLGALFVIILHHLFDSMWMVPIRRFVEQIACLFPALFVLFVPILILAPQIYPWMNPANQDHALAVKSGYLNVPMWYVRAFVVFGVWTFLAFGFRKWSLRQDKTGAAECTIMMRRYAGGGVVLFALTLTAAVIDWVKSMEHHWFSTMYGVYYFAESVWVSLITFYVIALILQRSGPLKHVVGPRQFHDFGMLFFAFTVFYAYIHFGQYFLIWNASLPEETFWYIQREQGTWWDVGMIIIFGHFLLPFLALLRIDTKLNLAVMIPLCVWAWFCHFCDGSFNIMPVLHPEGFRPGILDLACLVLMGGVLAEVFIRNFKAHPAYPLRDPRMAETMGVYVPPANASVHAAASK